MPEQAKRIDRFLTPLRAVVLTLAVGYALFAIVHEFYTHRAKVEVLVIAAPSRAGARVFADGEFVGRLVAGAANDSSLRAWLRMPQSWQHVYLITSDGDTLHADATSKGHFAMADFDSVGLRERLVAMPD